MMYTFFFNYSVIASYSSGPLIGYLADVRFGRYEVIKFGSFASFLASILYYFALFTRGDDSVLSNVMSSLAVVAICFGTACFIVAMVPFLTDQIIGATSDELSAIARWYYWTQYAGIGFSYTVIYLYSISNLNHIEFIFPLIYAIPLAVIIISDCLCQQWLDRTHKVTNPIKLIVQVLNYTRKHRYPERRSAFTYIDEEQPTRMDYGKEKFGGPFTEEEVEDVKTVLRLIPLVTCLSLMVAILNIAVYPYTFESIPLVSEAISFFICPTVLIPLYQLLLFRCFHRCNPSMLQRISAGLLMTILGYILLTLLRVVGIIITDDVHKYLSCTEQVPNVLYSANQTDTLWEIGIWTLYGTGSTISAVLFIELIIAQSPDKMKGFVMAVVILFHGTSAILFVGFHSFVYCLDLFISLSIVVLFVVFLILSKCYTLRERNREINIQAIVEEHYERYMDQEEEYTRHYHQYFESLESDSYIDDDSD